MKTFGELTKQEKMELFEAWLGGSIIECLSKDEASWELLYNPSWYTDTSYRIKPAKPSIIWDHVSDKFNYLLGTRTDKGALCTIKPNSIGSGWQISGVFVEASTFSSFKPSTCKPEDSLVVRPGYIEPSE